MSDDFVFVAEGMTDFVEKMRDLGDISPKASMAVNDALAWARTRAATLMLKEVDWPSSYLNPGEGRFTIAEYSTPSTLEGKIKGRDRPTSLARFVRSGTGKAGSPLSLAVKRGGSPTVFKHAFLMRLRSGNSGATGNMGLAYRTKDGKPPSGAWKPKQIGKNLFLLYGPSVDQVFRNVLDRDREFIDQVTTHLDLEFRRLLGVDL